MSHSSRQILIVGNWKMYKTISESVNFIKELAPLLKDNSSKVYLAVPFTAINPAAEEAKETSIVIGAQNMNDASEGAFTGEIAARMLKDAGAKFVILGHSERRHIFHESNDFINKKVKRALLEGLEVILCIGETLKEREDNKTADILQAQLKQGLAGISEESLKNIIIAYEPVWAIGTDHAATPESAQKEHHFCRSFIAETFGEKFAEKLLILYGGSVKPNNAKLLLDQKDIDGLLVGGASLSAETFSKIVNYQNT